MHSRTSGVTRSTAARPPVVLIASGLDPSGGAGLLMDAAVARASGAHPAGVVTCRTGQSPRGVFAITATPTAELRSTLAILVRDLPVAALKIGLVGSPGNARALASTARSAGVPVVLDPVLRSTSGFRFAGPSTVRALREWLIPAAALLTPNREEAAFLAGRSVDSIADAVDAGRRILELGPRAVLVKGIPWRGRRADVLVDRTDRPRTFSAREMKRVDPHGTGCALSSAVAARLAAGDALGEAVKRARRLLLAAMRRRFVPLKGGLEYLWPSAP